MAGLLGHQAAVGLLDGRPVVDHRVDLVRDRHHDAVLLGDAIARVERLLELVARVEVEDVRLGTDLSEKVKNPVNVS